MYDIVYGSETSVSRTQKNKTECESGQRTVALFRIRRRKSGQRGTLNRGATTPRSARQRTMAALLRHGAARRLCGFMRQRAQATVAGEQRRLVHVDESVRKEVMMEIQQKKEELYDVLSKAERDYYVTNWSNRRLLQNLSVQVAPRPYDGKWYRLRIVKRINNFVETAGLVSLSGVMGVGLLFLDWPPAKKEAPVASKSSAETLRAENL